MADIEKQYNLKPPVYGAVQWSGEPGDAEDLLEWAVQYDPAVTITIAFRDGEPILLITIGGVQNELTAGDYVVHDEGGGLAVWSQADFDASFVEVNDPTPLSGEQ